MMRARYNSSRPEEESVTRRHATCCEIGSLIGEVTRGERNRIKEFGKQLGTAFQLKDDCLDYKADLVKSFVAFASEKFVDKTLVPVIDSTYPLAQIGQAHERMLANKNVGKIVLTMPVWHKEHAVTSTGGEL